MEVIQNIDNSLIQAVDTLYNDPFVYSETVLHIELDDQQQKIANALYGPKQWVTVRSGRGAGKTWVAAVLIWHFLCTRYNAQVYITAASGGTISGAIWPTVAKLYDDMHPMYKNQFEFQTAQIKHKEHPFTWFAITRTARQENPEAMAGSHAKKMLFLIDEASGVSDAMIRSIIGSLTEDDNYLIMLSNPTRLKGMFYESHKPKNKDKYEQIQMDARKSKWVKPKSIAYWADTFGIDSDEYRINVLGDFPDKEHRAIIPWDLVNEASERELPEDDYKDIPIIWGLDVGTSNDKSVLVKRQGPKVIDIKKWKHKDTMVTAGKVIMEYNETEDDLKPERIYVDTIGIGKGPADRLREQELPIHPAVASSKAIKKKYMYNNKAEWWHEALEWFKGEVQIPNDSEFVDQVTGVRATPSSDSRFRVEGKENYIKRYRCSSDTADAFVMTFCLRSRHEVGLITGD